MCLLLLKFSTTLNWGTSVESKPLGKTLQSLPAIPSIWALAICTHYFDAVDVGNKICIFVSQDFVSKDKGTIVIEAEYLAGMEL